jgi:Flp pilus assembly protein TadG
MMRRRGTDPDARAESREDGFVLMWMALVLVLLLSVAAFGVDLVHAYQEAQHAQTAADAAALAGAVEIPTDTSGTNAHNRACDVLQQNYAITCGAKVTATKDIATPNQMDVDVKSTFNTFFAKIMGFSTLTVHRTAKAQYDPPVQMGSAANYVGNVPECPTTGSLPGPSAGPSCENVTASEFLWASIMGPDAGKHNGNAYSTKNCNNVPIPRPINPDECIGNTNHEYDAGGEYFRVRKDTGGAVDIWAYDPGYTSQFPWCGNTLGGAVPTTNASSWAADGNPDHAVIALQYTDLKYCAGDSDLPTATGVASSPTSTTYDFFAPDADRDPTNNPPAGCGSRTFPGYADTNAAHTAEQSGVQTGFHRWVKLCTLTGPATGTSGNDYEVRVSTTSGTGVNNFSLMALPAGGGGPGPVLGVYASEKLPIAAVNFPSVSGVTTSTFYLARVLPSTHSRKLEVDFFDLGDTSVPGGSSQGTLSLATTPDVSGASFACKFTPPPSTGAAAQFLPFADSAFTGSGCTLSYNTVDAASNTWNGRWVGLTIDVPSSYNCNTSIYQGCWIQLKVSPSGGSALSDATTWNASLKGSPVRLTG